jgi:hypothetical protein
MSVSRRELRRLQSAGWEVVPVGPGVRVRRVLWHLVSGRRPAPALTVVPARRGSR